jgi:8-oxo-dGTP diphosphatase
MKLTTLCYLERDEKYLMLHRIKKQKDVNKDKWIGIGGKFEFGESPEDCLLREAKEETGYELFSYRLRGIVTFLFNDEEAEYMFLYTADGFAGEPRLCDEGTLEWIPKKDVDALNLWEGDRLFFKLMNEERPFFSLKLHYRGDRLCEAVLDGRPLELLDVLNVDGEPSGLVRERGMVHERGDYHRTSHVWIVRRMPDRSCELLLQKRSREKDSFAGCYDISSAGHIPAGEDYLPSARRELFEELGILAGPDDLTRIGFVDSLYEGVFQGKPFRNHEKSAVYVYEKPIDETALLLQASEVESVRWFPLDDALRAAREQEPGFCLHADEVGMVGKYIAESLQKDREQP